MNTSSAISWVNGDNRLMRAHNYETQPTAVIGPIMHRADRSTKQSANQEVWRAMDAVLAFP
jgi:hypothetical protein